MLYTFLLLFLYFDLYFNVEPLRVSMFVNKETTYLLTQVTVPNLSNDTTFNDLESPLTQISRSRQFSK